MDLNTLREAAIEATARALDDKLGYVPSDDSDEWEEEYRRQFAALRQRHGGDLQARRAAPGGAPGAAAVRSEAGPSCPARRSRSAGRRRSATSGCARSRASRSASFSREPGRAPSNGSIRATCRPRCWYTRLRPQFEEYRKQQEEAARARAAAATQKAAELAAYQQRLKEAGITPDGLVELIDASERFDPAPLAAKLAEIAVEGRHLRVYETSDPNLLLVKEKRGPAAARRLRDRARRGAGRRPQAVRAGAVAAGPALTTRSAARWRGCGQRRWFRSRRERAGNCAGNGGNRPGPVRAPFRSRARRHRRSAARG